MIISISNVVNFLKKFMLNSMINEKYFVLVFVLTLLLIFVFIIFIFKSKSHRKISNPMPVALNKFLNYFLNFGWLLFGGIAILFLLFLLFPNCFHFFLLLVIIGFFILSPLKFIYILVGSRNSLRSFFLLFLLTQIIFSGIYYLQFNGYKINEHKEVVKINTVTDDLNKNILTIPVTPNIDSIKVVQSVPEIDTNMQSKATSISLEVIFLNTFYVSLIQESGTLFNYIIEDENHELYSRVYITLIIQILLSWIYLGVLIASLYQKLRNE